MKDRPKVRYFPMADQKRLFLSRLHLCQLGALTAATVYSHPNVLPLSDVWWTTGYSLHKVFWY